MKAYSQSFTQAEIPVIAKKIIGYEPKVDLQEGLKRTWNWYLKNKNENDLRHNYFKNDN